MVDHSAAELRAPEGSVEYEANCTFRAWLESTVNGGEGHHGHPRNLGAIVFRFAIPNGRNSCYAESVKLCHTAALALVGWYLMLPMLREKSFTPDSNAPLSEWWIQSSFDTAAECEEARTNLQRGIQLPAKGGRVDAGSAVRLMAHCIASDDPRLKGD